MRNLLKIALVASAALAPIAASAEPVVGLIDSSAIVTFDSANPGVITSRAALVGVAPGDRLLGIDLRPANNQLYSVGASGTVYLITPAADGTFTATAQTNTAVSVPGATSTGSAPSGTSFGIDFNPVPDRLRIISDANQNLRTNVAPGGGTLTDTPVTLNGSSVVDIVASAYTNSFAGATTTELFNLDAVTDSLLRSPNPNGGTNVIVGGLGAGITFTNTDRVAFDISGATNDAIFTINDALFRVNLASGAGSFIGTLGATGIVGITFASVSAVPEPATWGMMLIGFGAVGYSLRRRKTTTATLAAA